MKIHRFVVFLGMSLAVFLPHSGLSMNNYHFMQDNALIPFVQLIASGGSALVVKNNTFALKENNCVRIWNLEKLSAHNRVPSHEYPLLTGTGAHHFMDLDDSGTKLLLQRQISNQLARSNIICIYDLLTNHFFYKIDTHTDSEKKLKKTEDLYHTGIVGARFFDANTVVTVDYNAIHVWKSSQQPTGKIELISIDMPIGSSTEAMSLCCCEHPVVAVHQVEKKFAYFKEDIGLLEGKNASKKYLFTNHNYRHSCFVFLILRQLLLPQDMVYEIASRIESSAVQQIDTEKIKNDTIVSMEYSPDGSTFALTGFNNNYLCKPQEADRENKNCISKMPASGFLTFHPNNKTLFVMDANQRKLLGIDIKTKKIIYEYKPLGEVGMHIACGEQNQALAFNKKGDKLAVAFYEHCQIYDVPESLQQFLNTYDPEIIGLEPEKRVFAPVKKQQKQGKRENCIVQ